MVVIRRLAPVVLLGLVAVLALAPGSASGAGLPAPFRGTSLWVVRASPEDAATLTAAARAAGARTLLVKAAEGASPEPQFTPTLVARLRAGGVGVCAWAFDSGAAPAAEAAAAAAGGAQAGCLVVDAEGEYDCRYRAAQVFVRALRAQLGSSFPIALAGQAEVLEHPQFPYSVFLGPGGFDADMPQVYWLDFGQSVAAAFANSVPINSIYGRPIVPVGQLYNDPTPSQVASFGQESALYGLAGRSFFDVDSASGEDLAALGQASAGPARVRVRPPTLHAGADGDEIVWAQELLDAAGARLPIGGFFGGQTERAVVRFQARHRLRRSGLLDAATWTALERLRAHEPSWRAPPALCAAS